MHAPIVGFMGKLMQVMCTLAGAAFATWLSFWIGSAVGLRFDLQLHLITSMEVTHTQPHSVSALFLGGLLCYLSTGSVTDVLPNSTSGGVSVSLLYTLELYYC